MPTVSWCFREASIIKPVVSYLLCVRADMNSRALLNPSVFYHPGPLNTMADDASRRFDLPDNNFLSFFWSKYRPSHSAGLWTLCRPPIEITSCVISVLRKRISRLEIFTTTTPPSFTKNSENYAPQCGSSIGLMILPSQWQRPFKCMVTRSVTEIGLSFLKSERTWCLWRGELSPRYTSWMDAPTPENLVAPPPDNSISASATSSEPILFRTHPHSNGVT